MATKKQRAEAFEAHRKHLHRVTDRVRNVLTQGEGLRPVLRYSRQVPCEVIRIDHAVNLGHVGEYAVTFYWPDTGAECLTYWADWRVLVGWVLGRVHKGGTMACVHRVNMASLTGEDGPGLYEATKGLRKAGIQTVLPASGVRPALERN